MKEVIIGANEGGQRLDKFLAKYLKEAEKSFIYKMLRKKNITLNGKKADGSERINQGDSVKLFLSEETLAKFRGAAPEAVVKTNVKLSVIYENPDVIFINKPAGMLSQKAVPSDVSLCEHMISYLLESGQLKEEELATFRPGVCNRLDRNTSGLVMGGKSLQGLQFLSEMLKYRHLEKYYLAIVGGSMTQKQRIHGFLYKDEVSNTVSIHEKQIPDSVPIETEYEPVQTLNGKFTLVRVQLITGKTHQIRAHLASIGHPVLGDSKYGSRELNREFCREYPLRHQLLHAYQVVFPKELPNAGTVVYNENLQALAGKTFTADLPVNFQKCLTLLGGSKNVGNKRP